MDNNFVSLILKIQGWFYFITGIWAIASLESFNSIVGIHNGYGSAFEMHTISAMAIALGLFFIPAAKNIKKHIFVVGIAAAVALSIVMVEIVYLPTMGWNLFWIDLFIEIFFAIILGNYFLKSYKNRL